MTPVHNRLPDLIETYQPQYLFIELGGNDFLKGVNIHTTEINLRAIIQMAKTHQIPALLIAIPDFNPVKAAFSALEDHAIYAKIATDTQTPIVENALSDVLDSNDLKSDYVHPNAKGYQIVTNNMITSLQTIGLFKE